MNHQSLALDGDASDMPIFEDVQQDHTDEFVGDLVYGVACVLLLLVISDVLAEYYVQDTGACDPVESDLEWSIRLECCC